MGIKFKEIYESDYEGYHGGEGFGNQIQTLVDIEYEEVEEGILEYIRESIYIDKDGTLELDLENFAKFPELEIEVENYYNSSETQSFLAIKDIGMTKKDIIEILLEELKKYPKEKIKKYLSEELKEQIKVKKEEKEKSISSLYKLNFTQNPIKVNSIKKDIESLEKEEKSLILIKDNLKKISSQKQRKLSNSKLKISK